jgi:hypothetical protein
MHNNEANCVNRCEFDGWFGGKWGLEINTVKVKLTLCLIKHHAMKTYGEM